MNYNHFTLPFLELTFFYVMISIVLFLALKNTRIKTTSSSIDKDTSNLLKGVFIFTVVMHHIAQRTIPNNILDSGLLKIYGQAGYLSVGVFFLLSGYGLSASSKKGKESFIYFTQKKLTRVYLPCIALNILLLVMLSTEMTLFTAFIPTSIDSTQWFISAILLFYFFQHLSTKFRINNIIFIITCMLIYTVGCKLMNLDFWWYISSLCFPLGFFWNKYRNHIDQQLLKLNAYHISLIVTLSLALMLLKIFDSKIGFIACPAFCLLLLLFISKFEIKSKAISILGVYSLEVYILHMKIMWGLEYILESNNFTNSIWIIPYFIILFLCAHLFYKFNNYFMKLIK